jgi:hypothetical protein
MVELVASRYDSSLSPNTTRLDVFLQQVQISSAGGSVQAQVVDECFGCGTDDLGECSSRNNRHISFFPLIGTSFADMSPETFQSLDPAGQDVISEEIAITWNFV